jgi:D-alanyl-D-alanine carboxypeptidase-like protein
MSAAAGAALLVLVCIAPGNAAETYGAPPPDLAASLDRLVRAYPDWIAGHDSEFLILKNGRKFPISDRRTDKTFDQLIESSDIDDMFYAAYPVNTRPKQPAKNADPGRVRFGPLFAAMYGDCKKNEVAKKLRTIQWMPQHGGGRVVITTANGVDKALEAVSRELDQLPANLAKAAFPSAGTYNCRTVAGSGVTSMHAYGAAIDLNTRYSDYWRWAAKGGADPVWKNRMPVEIVPLFEKHGFIWGGYWYHFDTMHFEYRPELLPESLPSPPQ